MKGLFVKDLKIILCQKNLLLVAIGLAAMLTWTTEDVTFAATYIILLLSMFTLTTISYDNLNGGMLFLLSLPVDRKLYIKEKYIFAFANLVFATIVSLCVSYGFAVLRGLDLVFTDLLSTVMGIAAGMVLMLGITIPLELKFGVEKGRVAMIITIVAIAVIGYGGCQLLTNVFDVDVNGIVAKVLEKLSQSGVGVEFFAIGMLLIILILFVSYVVSLKIMKKKEF